jgi:hypothetical protein
MELEILKTNEDFIDFFCQKEDKWLQHADFNEKINAIFGNTEIAIKEFEKYKLENNL